MDVTTNTTSYNFPSHDVDPAEKGSAWCMQYLRAMYTEATTRQYAKIFFAARDDYKKFKEYGLSKQSVLPYRKWLTGSEASDKSWVNINWSIPPIASKYRNILVNKLMEREYNIVCTPIDPAAVDETSKWFADLKAKTKMREVAQKVNPELLQTAALTKRGEDPENMEDFQMRSVLGFRNYMAMEAELGVQVIFEKTKFREERRMVIEDRVDLGVGIYIDGIDENDEVFIRRVNPINFMCSYCRRNDFSDMTWGGEQIWVKLSDLVAYFTPEQLKKIAENVAGKNGNPRNIPYNFSMSDYDRFKVLVLDGKWLSYDVQSYKRGYDGRGNYFVKRKPVNKRDADATVMVEGHAKPMFSKDSTEVVYKGKWIVDTEYVYDFGLETDQKRKRSTWRKARLPFNAYAPDFYEMSALGIMERMIPFVDNYCQIWYKIQNWQNRWIPYIINIDLSALENVPLGKGGKKLTPKEVLRMLYDTNIITTRQKNAVTGMNDQNRPVTVEATQMAQEITVLIGQLQQSIQNIRDVTGINEALDASGPADRTNVLAQQQAQQGSNNAINHFVYADSVQMAEVADSALMRLQRVLKRGKKVSGYVKALGTNYLKFVQVSSDISLHEYAIKVEERPDKEIKQMLMQQLAIADQNGRINPEDFFMIMNMTNLKEMEMKFVYLIKKRKAEEEQAKLQASQQQSAGAAQVAQSAESAKQKTAEIKGEQDRKTAEVVGAFQVEAAKVRAKSAIDAETTAALKEIFMEVMGQFHENGQGFGAAPGGQPADPGSSPAAGVPPPGVGAPVPGNYQPAPASLME